MDADEARRRLYDVMREDAGFSAKATRVLEIGRSYLEVDRGAVSRVDPSADYWEAVESTDPPDGEFAAGCRLDLGQTFCRHVIEDDEPLSVHDASAQGRGDDPPVQSLGLHCYQGAPIAVGDEIYGTVCFGAAEPRSDRFSDEETMFTDLIGRMLGDAIERQHHQAELADRERLIGALNRVLRHNLRNDLNVVQGRVRMMRDRLPADADESAAVIDTIDDLLELGEKARRLESLLDAPTTGRTLEAASFARRVVAEAADDHPEASFAVDPPTDEEATVPASLEPALRELLENAAKHAGPDPNVTVLIAVTDERKLLRVADDGPGLPDQERTVLEKGAETPLGHGSGLGLWLVYWVVSRLEGSLEADVSDRGTTFTVALPHGPRRVPTTIETTLEERR